MDKSQLKPIYVPNDEPMSVTVFLSGSGTNFIAIHEEQKRLERVGEKNYGKVDLVFTNVPNCKGAQLAQEYDIPVVNLSSKKFFEIIEKDPDDNESRDSYDAAVIATIEEYCDTDLIVLAGYRRRLSSKFLNRYHNRIINLYPGDITKDYLVKGTEAWIQALSAGEDSIKCSVYMERDNERFGSAILQSQPISLSGFAEKDTILANERIRQEGEWIIFPYAVHNLIAKGCLAVDQEDNIYLEGVKLSKEGLQFGS
ncbi:MAG: phosphoribosylglycinamide formyltransferase [Thermodesulfobacteriota bacterium]|nr:MAG: phosphoribosylglycinamide formyltransferase [Thermodesulfobacteriota bacterium]